MWRPGRSRRAVNRPLTALAARVSADGPSGRSAADGFMEPSSIGMAGLGIAGLSTLGAFGLAFRQRRRRLRAGAALPATREPRSAADRLEALGQAQAQLGLRLDALAAKAGAPEERLQAMAGQLVGLIRDKNATLETALAGLDQLRARMRALEQMGEPAEARALVDGLGLRLDGLGAGPGRARGAARRARRSGVDRGRGARRAADRARGEAHRRARGDAGAAGAAGGEARGALSRARRRGGGRARGAEAARDEARGAGGRGVGGEVRARGAEGRGRGRARARRAADPGAGAEGGAGRHPRRPGRGGRGRARREGPDPGARPPRRAAGDARRRREPVRGDLRAADPALRAEGRDRRDGVRAAGALGGAAGRARPDGGARPLRRAAGGGAGPGGDDRDAPRTRSRRSPSS